MSADDRFEAGTFAGDAGPAPRPEPQPDPPNGIFVGPLGLRAGWGIALFFLLAGVLGSALFFGLFAATGQLKAFRQQSTAAQAAHERHEPAPATQLAPLQAFLPETAEAAAVLIVGWAISIVERRRFWVYGMGLRSARDLLPGAFWGLASLGVLIGCLRALHLLVFDRQLLHGAAILRYGLAWLAVFFLVGVFEEFFFRGYIQFTLMRGLLAAAGRISPAHVRRTAFWAAALVWSTLFSVTHLANVGEDPAGIVMVFAAGFLFSYALWRTGSLWWGIGFHLTWDWGQSFLFGVPDSGNLSAGRLFATHAVGRSVLSGGGTGPEGSLLVLPVLLLAALAIRFHAAKPQPPVEPERLPAAEPEVSPHRIP